MAIVLTLFASLLVSREGHAAPAGNCAQDIWAINQAPFNTLNVFPNWLMAPTTAKGVFALTNVTNDILFPPGMPEECYFSGRHSNWYHQGYLSDWDPAPADDLFAVPPDADCPPAQSGHPLLDSPLEHVTLRGVLPLV